MDSCFSFGFGFTKAKASASASASWFQKLKASASASASWFDQSFGFVTSQIQNSTFGFLVSKLEKLNIFHFQIMFARIFCLNFNKWQVIKGNSWEASGLRVWLQLRALKKLKLRLQLRAFKKSKPRLPLQLRNLIKASASLRLRNPGLRTHVWASLDGEIEGFEICQWVLNWANLCKCTVGSYVSLSVCPKSH